MRRCPSCDENLERTTYEDLWVEQCVSCQGVLVSERRLEAIRRRPDTSPKELRSQIERAAPAPSRDATRCPKCTVFVCVLLASQMHPLHCDTLVTNGGG
ncbi:MAG: zf-TFIIB domain-containing protein [Planctomycetota bacterium]